MPKFIEAASIALLLAMSGVGYAHAQEGSTSASERLAQPGPEHAWLEPLVGSWRVEMLVYPTAGAEPYVTTGLSATRDWVLDKRYLQEALMGPEPDRTPLRVGTLGFNRLDGRFEFVTADAFEPGQMIYLGRGDAASETFSLYGESTEAGMGPEPTGRKRDLRFEFTVVDDATNVERIFVTYPGEAEFLFVEQRFTRAQ